MGVLSGLTRVEGDTFQKYKAEGNFEALLADINENFDAYDQLSLGKAMEEIEDIFMYTELDDVVGLDQERFMDDNMLYDWLAYYESDHGSYENVMIFPPDMTKTVAFIFITKNIQYFRETVLDGLDDEYQRQEREIILQYIESFISFFQEAAQQGSAVIHTYGWKDLPSLEGTTQGPKWVVIKEVVMNYRKYLNHLFRGSVDVSFIDTTKKGLISKL